jgi:hypothetical protein
MKTWKIFPGICLAVTLVLSSPGAWAALVNKPSQPVILAGNSGSDTSGILSFAKLNRIKSDGTAVPFVLPSHQKIVITWIQFNFNPVDTSLVTNVDLRVGPYFSWPAKINNGLAYFSDAGIDPGFIINSQGFTDPRYNNFYAVNLANSSIIPGKISVRLIGYLVTIL